MPLLLSSYTAEPYSQAAPGAASRTTSGSYAVPAGAMGIVLLKCANDSVNDVPAIALSGSVSGPLQDIVGVTRGQPASAYEPAMKFARFIGTGAPQTFTATIGTGLGSSGSPPGTGAVNGRQWLFEVYSVTGFDALNPIGLSASTGDLAASSGAASLALGGTTKADSLVLAALLGITDPGATSIAVGSGFTELLDYGVPSWYSSQTQYRIGALSSIPWANVNVDAANYYYTPMACGFEINAAPGMTLQIRAEIERPNVLLRM